MRGRLRQIWTGLQQRLPWQNKRRQSLKGITTITPKHSSGSRMGAVEEHTGFTIQELAGISGAGDLPPKRKRK
ncbi:MAG: hypothetical protein COV47_03765 [Candidatus Diapherotrites archaeon CG11_big_fil_rev_8_21_14_0_20_37_9]|nr:MAG: hypothetical protein COV47_03765 [Candidatus Diapherotrites archaeon CG11_big_fil_rev_8_21_14_0_20_37_9]